MKKSNVKSSHNNAEPAVPSTGMTSATSTCQAAIPPTAIAANPPVSEKSPTPLRFQFDGQPKHAGMLSEVRAFFRTHDGIVALSIIAKDERRDYLQVCGDLRLEEAKAISGRLGEAIKVRSRNAGSMTVWCLEQLPASRRFGCDSLQVEFERDFQARVICGVRFETDRLRLELRGSHVRAVLWLDSTWAAALVSDFERSITHAEEFR